MAADPAGDRTWNYHPEVPLPPVPLFVWPPRPLAAVRWLLGRGFVVSLYPIYILMAIGTWYLCGPTPERWATFELDWIATVFALNLGATVLMAGSLHLYLYTFRRQGDERRMDLRELGRNNPRFFTGDQVRDNVFHTCASGVTVWTALQVLLMWAYANGLVPWTYWDASPIWFVALFPLLVIWQSLHFYFVHRLLHWPPLYRRVHALHHRNVNVGPWSGFSMHPIEQLLYFSTLLIHVVVASHPVHLFYHGYFNALAAITSHTGYTGLTVRGREVVKLGDFFHQLHHRYFDCNYGTLTVPWDKWFGSDHDGTAEGTARVRRYQLTRRGGSAAANQH